MGDNGEHMKDIVIVGSGGVGAEIAWIVEQINIVEPTWNIIGFIDDNKEKWGQDFCGYKILGGLDYLKTLDNSINVIIAIANYKVKKTIVEKLEDKFEYATIVHPTVFIHNSVSLGKGSIIYQGVIITMNITIGEHVIVSPKCGIGHDTIIKDYVSLLWNVNVSGFDVIEEGVLMGTGSTVIQNKTIGQGAIIGAGAVVVNDIEGETTSVGVPSRIIKKLTS